MSVDDFKNKIIIGSVENVTIIGPHEECVYEGRIDTGATSSSIDSRIVANLDLGPVVSIKKVRNAHGDSLRPVIEVDIVLKNKKLTARFTVADRSKMKYDVLIGRNILKDNFLIDVTR